MVSLKRKLNNILSVVSIGILFVGLVLGILVKREDLKVAFKEQSDSQFEKNQSPSDTKVEPQQTVCREFLEEDENSLLLKEYNKREVAMVECLSVRCGGVF